MSRNVPRIFDPWMFFFLFEDTLFDETRKRFTQKERRRFPRGEGGDRSLVFFTESRIRTEGRTIAAISNKLFIRNRPR